MFEVGRDLWRSSGPNTLLSQGHLLPVAQDYKMNLKFFLTCLIAVQTLYTFIFFHHNIIFKTPLPSKTTQQIFERDVGGAFGLGVQQGTERIGGPWGLYVSELSEHALMFLTCSLEQFFRRKTALGYCCLAHHLHTQVCFCWCRSG